jgi:hypothetical protein
MNDIERLKRRIARALPNATLVLQVPNPPRPTAAWWLEVERQGHHVSIEWKPRRGFGLTSPAEGLGEGAEETYDDVGSTARRIVELIRAKGRTETPVARALAALRQQRRFSQEDLAKALNIRQAAVSKMERRGDMHVSTLRKAVKAMGGKLELRAKFPGEVVVIRDIGEDGR